MDYSPVQCLQCRAGWSKSGSDKCSLCGAGYYIDTNDTESKQNCKICPAGTNSIASSIGLESCTPMRPCTNSDIITVYGDCDKTPQTRTIRYEWIKPVLCDTRNPYSVSLPQQHVAPCKACSRG